MLHWICRDDNKVYSDFGAVKPATTDTHMTLHCFFRIGKLTLLLRESLGHTNCHTTVIAQIMDSLTHLQENFSTIQLASRFRRTQKRTKVV